MRNLKRLLRNESGLSLIEVVAATVLLTIVLTTFMSMFLIGVKTKGASEGTLDATYHVQAELESLISLRGNHDLAQFEHLLVAEKGYTKDGDLYTREFDENHEMQLELLDRTVSQGSARDVVVTLVGTSSPAAPVTMQTVMVWRNEP